MCLLLQSDPQNVRWEVKISVELVNNCHEFYFPFMVIILPFLVIVIIISLVIFLIQVKTTIVIHLFQVLLILFLKMELFE